MSQKDLAMWGKPGALLIPSSLRLAWEGERLPGWVLEELGLNKGATIAELEFAEWPDSPEVQARLQSYFTQLLRSRTEGVGNRRLVEVSELRAFDLSQLPWSTRTRNCLSRAGLLGNPTKLGSLTYEEILDLPAMGIRSAIDCAATLEAALNSSRSGDPYYGDTMNRSQDLRFMEQFAHYCDLDHISGLDPRFQGLLQPTSETLLDQLQQVALEPEGPVADELLPRLPALERKIREISAETLDVALDGFFDQISRLKGARKTALIARFGWAGEPPITLEEAGMLLRVTRERIRQIQAKIIRNLPPHPVFMPQLSSALAILADASPIKTKSAAALLVSKGIATRPFDPRSVLAAAANCGADATFSVELIRGEEYVVSKREEAASRRLLTIARALAGASGVANVADTLERLASDGYDIKESKVRQLLSSHSDVDFLTSDWFWFPDIPVARNRLRNICRRMLSVASPIEVSTLRGGVRREYTFRNSSSAHLGKLPFRVPPQQVMREFLAKHPEFQVCEDDRVKPAYPLDYRDELGERDQAIVRVLRGTPSCVLDRQTLFSECMKLGLNENSLTMTITYSPILEHLDLNIWTLRGVDINPAAVEAVRAANALRPRERRVQDYGWTTGGNIWIAATVPEYSSNYVIGVPGSVARYLQGQRFRAVGEDGLEYGTITVGESPTTSYGYGIFLNRMGAEEGDVLIAEFDITQQVVTLKLGDYELLDSMEA